MLSRALPVGWSDRQGIVIMKISFVFILIGFFAFGLRFRCNKESLNRMQIVSLATVTSL